MENKNNMWFGAIAGILIGLVGGWLLGYASVMPMRQSGMHMMSDGQMMQNTGGMNMKEMMDDMNAGLVGKTGDDFDKAFMLEMIVHHEGAVQMAQLAQKNAKHSEIKKLADDIVVAQNTEIASMKKWLADWYGVKY